VKVGVGLYALSTAVYLFEQGLNVAIFGKPLNLWREGMLEGMLLHSYWWATTISDPHKQYGLERYFREYGQLAIDLLPGTAGFDRDLSRRIEKRLSSKSEDVVSILV